MHDPADYIIGISLVILAGVGIAGLAVVWSRR